MGFEVKLYDIITETIDTIRCRNGINIEGAVEGFGKLSLVSNDMAASLLGTDIVMVVAPAVAHGDIAKACAPHLKDGQIILLHPGATGGALAFKKELTDSGCTASVTIAETNSLLYACRSLEPGRVSIFGIKNELMVAALPAVDNEIVLKKLNSAFPQMYAGTNVLDTSLGNPNAMMHPAPTVLNTSMIESKHDWRYYWDGITPTIGAFVETLDKERLAVGRLFGLDLIPIRAWYKRAYNAEGETLSQVVQNNPAYKSVMGQKTLLTRYLLEDVPMGLVPMAALAKIAGIDVPKMEMIIQMAECLVGKDLTSMGRSVESLGLSGMDVQGIRRLVESGR